MSQVMQGVREYEEWSQVEFDVRVADDHAETMRPIVRAFAEAGFAPLEIDLLDLIKWLRANRPELLGPAR